MSRKRKQRKKFNRKIKKMFLVKNKALITFLNVWRLKKFEKCVERCKQIVNIPHVHSWNGLPHLQRWSKNGPSWCSPYFVDIRLPKKELIRILIQRRLRDLGYYCNLPEARKYHRRIVSSYIIQKAWRKFKKRWLYSMAKEKLPVTTTRKISDTNGTKWYTEPNDQPYLPIITTNGIKLQVRAPFDKFVVKWTSWSLDPMILKPYTKLYDVDPVVERHIASRRIQTLWIKYTFNRLKQASIRLQHWWRKRRFFYRTVRTIQKKFHRKYIEDGYRFQITLDGLRKIFKYKNYRVLNYWNNPVNWTLDVDRMVIRRYINKTLQVIPYFQWNCRIIFNNTI